MSADGKQRSTVAKDLRGPVAMVQGPGALIYITEGAAGAISQIDTGSGAPASGRNPTWADSHPATVTASSVGALSLAEEFRFGLEMIILGMRVSSAGSTSERGRTGSI